MQNAVFAFSHAEYAISDLQQSIEQVFATSSLHTRLQAGCKVLLKPNLLAKHFPEKAVTTHPAVVTAVIRALKARGIQQITVADSPGGVYTPAIIKAIGQASGILQICQQEGAEFYTQCQFSQQKMQGNRLQSIALIDPVLQADVIINLPKMKTHVMTNMTAGVKNLFGTIPGLQKAELHMRFPDKQDFGEMLCDLCQQVAPALTILDAIVAMEGDGPAGGSPRQVGLLLASENVWHLDLAVCYLMNLDPLQVPYLAVAHQRGLCPDAFHRDWLKGNTKGFLPISEYRLPSNYVEMDFSNRFPIWLRWASPAIIKLATPKPKVQPQKCVGCGKCAEICPAKTIVMQDQKATIQPKACIRCFCCHEMCPVKAIDVVRPLGALFKL